MPTSVNNMLSAGGVGRGTEESHGTSGLSPPSRSGSRSRSMSPRGPSTSTQPVPAMATPTLSPRSSIIFASRPSPVVPSPSCPASPALSRPTSPRPTHDATTTTSPTRHHAHQHGAGGHHELAQHAISAATPSLSRNSSNVDLSHVFERDVEFASSHRISAQEAVDVAIAPVLDEAVVALSHTAPTTSSTDDPTATTGWSSPNILSSHPSSTPGLANLAAVGSRSPSRSNSTTTRPVGLGTISRSFSPDSPRDGRRATSPGSASATSTSFSVGTPPDSSDLSLGDFHGKQQQQPFSQHLADALEKEKHTVATASRDHLISSSILPQLKQGLGADGTFDPNLNSNPLGVFGTASGGGIGAPASPGLLDGDFDGPGRGLSFISYADVINEERLAELTGAPPGGEPDSPFPPGGTASPVVDLAGVLDTLALGQTTATVSAATSGGHA